VNYHADEEGTALNYEVLNNAMKEFRIDKEIFSDWKQDIDADYHRRKKNS
jgi:hypothetical protein